MFFYWPWLSAENLPISCRHWIIHRNQSLQLTFIILRESLVETVAAHIHTCQWLQMASRTALICDKKEVAHEVREKHIYIYPFRKFSLVSLHKICWLVTDWLLLLKRYQIRDKECLLLVRTASHRTWRRLGNCLWANDHQQTASLCVLQQTTSGQASLSTTN